jgi:FMN phosphatase YigB (HAD superfamily)
MEIKAVIFDIYDTLLKVERQTPEEAEKLWQNLYFEFFHALPPFGYQKLTEQCDMLIHQQHIQARLRRIKYPEILWDEILKIALPELNSLKNEHADEFFYRQSQVWHSVSMNRETAEFLKFLLKKNIIIGIASNCQKYTLKELTVTLQTYGFGIETFDSDLMFLSFKYGFSKPDPYVFQILTTRAHSKGIKPEEILIVGDSIQNDIEPAKLFGWKTWWLTNAEINQYENGGLWNGLMRQFA